MAGTRIGGQRAAKEMKRKYGEGYYKHLGMMGGKAGHSGGFASDSVGADGLTGRERARSAGKAARRPKAEN